MRRIGAHRQCLCRVEWGRRTLFCGRVCSRWADPTSSFLPPLCPPRCFSLSPYGSADLTLPCLDLLATGICHLGHALLLYSTRQRVHVGGGCGKFHASRLSHRATIRLAHSSARRTRARAAPDRAPAAPPRAARRWPRVQCASPRTWPQPNLRCRSSSRRVTVSVREAGSLRCTMPSSIAVQTTPHPI